MNADVLDTLRDWCQDLMAEYDVKAPIVIGSGGNINRLYKLSGGVGKAPISKEDARADAVRKLKKAASMQERWTVSG